jgi:hypothetical protein
MKIHTPAIFSAIVLILSPSLTAADIPDQSSRQFRGMYKVVSSTDPIFPANATTEYFMDFGKGIQGEKMSGSVAVSMRQNPNVKVRIMAWQYFPNHGSIAIGNPYAEGSRNAVAKGVWQMRANAKGVIFERGNYHVVLQRANPADY